MTTAKPLIYVHETTGDIQFAKNKLTARKLSKEYKRVEFVKNEAGERVMRLHLKGATVDVSENKLPVAIEGITDGKPKAD